MQKDFTGKTEQAKNNMMVFASISLYNIGSHIGSHSIIKMKE